MAIAHSLLSTDRHNLNNCAIVDCAADCALCPSPDGFDACEPVAAGVLEPCVAADGSAHHPVGHGIRIKRIALDDGRSLLAPLYYRCVPEIGFELTATSALTDLGLSIEIKGNEMRISTQDGGATSMCRSTPDHGKLHLLNELSAAGQQPWRVC